MKPRVVEVVAVDAEDNVSCERVLLGLYRESGYSRILYTRVCKSSLLSYMLHQYI